MSRPSYATSCTNACQNAGWDSGSPRFGRIELDLLQSGERAVGVHCFCVAHLTEDCERKVAPGECCLPRHSLLSGASRSLRAANSPSSMSAIVTSSARGLSRHPPSPFGLEIVTLDQVMDAGAKHLQACSNTDRVADHRVLSSIGCVQQSRHYAAPRYRRRTTESDERSGLVGAETGGLFLMIRRRQRSEPREAARGGLAGGAMLGLGGALSLSSGKRSRRRCAKMGPQWTSELSRT